MKKILVFGGLLLASIAWAVGEVRSTRVGPELTYALNGSRKFNQSVVDAAAGTPTGSAVIIDGADVWVQCSLDTFVINLPSTDGNAVITKMEKALADQMFHVGVLTTGVPFITIDSVTASSTTCKVFLAY